MRICTRFMHIRQIKPKVTRDPPSFLGTPWLHVEQENCFGAKKDKYSSDFIALYYYLFWTLYHPIGLFGTILLLDFIDFLPYTFIWPIRLFGTREYMHLNYIWSDKTFVNVPHHAIVLNLNVLPEITFNKHSECGLWTNVEYIRDYNIGCQQRRELHVRTAWMMEMITTTTTTTTTTMAKITH